MGKVEVPDELNEGRAEMGVTHRLRGGPRTLLLRDFVTTADLG